MNDEETEDRYADQGLLGLVSQRDGYFFVWKDGVLIGTRRTFDDAIKCLLRRRRNIELDRYRVVVGEVGIVFASESRLEAQHHFNHLLNQSKTIGFAWPGKSIALFKDYEIIREYHPPDAA